MKILFLTGHYGVGGKERQMTELIKGLPEKYEQYLFVRSQDAYYLEEIKVKLKGYRNISTSFFNFPKQIISMKKYLDEVKPDVVISWYTYFSHEALLLKKLFGYKYKLINCSIRSAPEPLTVHERLQALLYSLYPSYVVSNSMAGLKAFGECGREGRYVIYNGFNLSRVPQITKNEARSLLGYKPSTFIVPMVASLSARKDHTTFLKAVKSFFNKIPKADAIFLVIGDGARLNYYKKMSRSLGIENKVQFLGKVNTAENYFRASDISVLCSSRGEGLPNSVLESLFCGTPVIATNVGGNSEIVVENINGYLIQNKNHQDLSDKLVYLYKQPEVLEGMRAQCLNSVKDKFSYPKMVQSFITLIER